MAIKKFLESEDDKNVKKIAVREVKMLKVLAQCTTSCVCGVAYGWYIEVHPETPPQSFLWPF